MSEQERSAALQRLDVFIGQWEVDLVFPGDPPFKAHTSASFEWLDDRRFFLVYRIGVEGSELPWSRCIIGADDKLDTYSLLYSDSRGVSRSYQMTLRDGVWRQWRNDPTFYQRFSATFSPDGRSIKAVWENSEDGENWKHDFDLTYTKASG